MRIMSHVFRLTSFAALGLAGVVGYGTSTATAASPSATAGPPSGLKGVPSERAPHAAGERSRHAAFSDCPVANILGLAHAFDQAAIERAKMADERAQDPSVKQYAERSLDDHQKLEQELSRWEGDIGVQPVETDISRALNRNARVELKGLEDAQNFDREYVADEIGASIKAAGFLHLLLRAIHEGSGGAEKGQPTQPVEMGQPTQPGQVSIPQPGLPSLPQPGTFGTTGPQLPGQFGNQGFPGMPNFGDVGQGFPSPTPGGTPQEPVTGPQAPSGAGPTEGQPEPKLGEVTKLFDDAKHMIHSELEEALRLEGKLVGTCGESSSGEEPAMKKAPPLH
jgi:predicted outer membrane protein